MIFFAFYLLIQITRVYSNDVVFLIDSSPSVFNNDCNYPILIRKFTSELVSNLNDCNINYASSQYNYRGYLDYNFSNNNEDVYNKMLNYKFKKGMPTLIDEGLDIIIDLYKKNKKDNKIFFVLISDGDTLNRHNFKNKLLFYPFNSTTLTNILVKVPSSHSDNYIFKELNTKYWDLNCLSNPLNDIMNNYSFCYELSTETSTYTTTDTTTETSTDTTTETSTDTTTKTSTDTTTETSTDTITETSTDTPTLNKTSMRIFIPKYTTTKFILQNVTYNTIKSKYSTSKVSYLNNPNLSKKIYKGDKKKNFEYIYIIYILLCMIGLVVISMIIKKKIIKKNLNSIKEINLRRQNPIYNKDIPKIVDNNLYETIEDKSYRTISNNTYDTINV